MSVIDTYCEAMAFNRTRTLGLLEQAEQSEDALGWRPGDGRAHIAWQVMHIGVTEELFATERLRPENSGKFQDQWPRFRGGSTPDDNIPSGEDIRQLLQSARDSLLDTLTSFDDSHLGTVVFPQRDWSLRMVLQVLCWHESHHQGQAHITWNLYQAQA